MRRAWLLLALAALAAGGCGQKGPLYLPDKKARVVTTAPPADTAPPAPAAAAPDNAPPDAAPAPKAHDKDQDSEQPPPK